MKRKDELFIEVLILARNMLESMEEDEIQAQFGSDYYYELQRFIGWEAMGHWREKG
ncbi:hypothetical protein [Peribacillus saganii]|uniref:hypothetical protein n=1 Tax=Peribacillus saganii TaxID=2303992 RepID=UPI0013140408|nr:hypothetical protein [Peribacillus saganii]